MTTNESCLTIIDNPVGLLLTDDKDVEADIRQELDEAIEIDYSSRPMVIDNSFRSRSDRFFTKITGRHLISLFILLHIILLIIFIFFYNHGFCLISRDPRPHENDNMYIQCSGVWLKEYNCEDFHMFHEEHGKCVPWNMTTTSSPTTFETTRLSTNEQTSPKGSKSPIRRREVERETSVDRLGSPRDDNDYQDDSTPGGFYLQNDDDTPREVDKSHVISDRSARTVILLKDADQENYSRNGEVLHKIEKDKDLEDASLLGDLIDVGPSQENQEGDEPQVIRDNISNRSARSVILLQDADQEDHSQNEEVVYETEKDKDLEDASLLGDFIDVGPSQEYYDPSEEADKSYQIVKIKDRAPRSGAVFEDNDQDDQSRNEEVVYRTDKDQELEDVSLLGDYIDIGLSDEKIMEYKIDGNEESGKKPDGNWNQ